jgi:hypothetical protein
MRKNPSRRCGYREGNNGVLLQERGEGFTCEVFVRWKEEPHAGDKREEFYFELILYHLSLEVGRNSMSFPIFNGPSGQKEDLGRLTHIPVLILRKLAGGNFHLNLTKYLQLKWGSLGSDEMGQGGGAGCFKSGHMIFTSLKLSLNLACLKITSLC